MRLADRAAPWQHEQPFLDGAASGTPPFAPPFVVVDGVCVAHTAAVARGSGHAVPGGHTYVDLSLAQVMLGLAYAFPRGFAAFAPQVPR